MSEKKYDLSKLYKGLICGVRCKKIGGTITTKGKNRYFSVLQLNSSDRCYDIILDKTYKLFEKCSYENISKNMSDFYVCSLEPLRLSLKIDANIREMTQSEIYRLFNNMNNIKERKNNSIISNPFFIEVMKVKEKITGNLDPNLVNYYNDKLMEISKIYTESLVHNYEKIKLNPSYELEIINECLISLTNLEAEINKINEISNFSTDLLSDFDTLTEKIKKI